MGPQAHLQKFSARPFPRHDSNSRLQETMKTETAQYTSLVVCTLMRPLMYQGLKFRETPGDYDFDFHTAPARQLVVSLDAGVEIEVTDGTRTIFPAGTVMLVEDTWGKVCM